jgi:hypothetical protein
MVLSIKPGLRVSSIFDELAKSRKTVFFVIPANPGSIISGAGAGIQSIQLVLDPGVRGVTAWETFYDTIIFEIRYF